MILRIYLIFAAISISTFILATLLSLVLTYVLRRRAREGPRV